MEPATLWPENSDLIVEVAALYLTSVKQPHNRLRIIDHLIQVPRVLNKVVFKHDGNVAFCEVTGQRINRGD